ncbi:DUF3224 domain-containing protein [Idiomarina tyrosinivorans]|uniref:DUF3224 domain-containing protein n=1 Tax=Idiomarina tyrosinivorans TaxID=1445662 RepID=A0A432ZTW5_9GAMM|nr:DUF3224 domain-containing protein [Idiomarina tyrosinivorans]RUO81226.1 DUF3224 domain-containing protein [Idiomarina tyrosinivorans]
MKISGQFDVKLNPLDTFTKGRDTIKLGRMAIEKVFHGELTASSKGEMLSAMTPVKGSAGYVAIEQVSGTLCERDGSFVLQHYGIMNRGEDKLVLEVLPDSGTGQLQGLRGQMAISVENGEHYYQFDFSLPDLAE